MDSVREYFETLPSRVPAKNTAGMTNSYLVEITDVGTVPSSTATCQVGAASKLQTILG